MNAHSIPPELEAVVASDESVESKLSNLIVLLGEALRCDRCLLFLRDPRTRRSYNSHGWTRRPEYALKQTRESWSQEPVSLADDDPMFALALRDPNALYIEDIETAGPDVLNRDYERDLFGHRALIHAPIYYQDLMFGIFEPCVFCKPRQWTEFDRAVTVWAQTKLGPMAAEYVALHCPDDSES
ncbi:MAG: GAF domain-containing protein [Gammaproteobacteria bacterium]|nr:GAF domain-containing protein [Gammaproteobacteria bacterium]